MKASMFKYKTQLYEINHLIETAHIQKAMEDGTYKPEPGLKFGIKKEDTHGISRVLQPQTRR